MSGVIGQVLGFTDEELAANRAGRMLDAQRARMQTAKARGRAFTVVIALLVVVFIVVIAAVVLPSLPSSTALPAVGALVLMGLVMTLSIARTRRRLEQFTGRVERVEGPAKTCEHLLHGNVGDPLAGVPGYGGGIRFELTIGGTRFFVASKAVLDVFDDGRTYRGYYVSRGVMATLLSAEPVA